MSFFGTSQQRGPRHEVLYDSDFPGANSGTIRRPLEANYYWYGTGIGKNGKPFGMVFYRRSWIGGYSAKGAKRLVRSLNKSIERQIRRGKTPPLSMEPNQQITTVGRLKLNKENEAFEDLRLEAAFEAKQKAYGIQKQFADSERPGTPSTEELYRAEQARREAEYVPPVFSEEEKRNLDGITSALISYRDRLYAETSNRNLLENK